MAELINKTDTLNQGRVKLNVAITDAEKAKVVSKQADGKATQALANSESTQTQLDTIVIEGDSSVEAAQARVDEKGESHPTLKERIDDGFMEVSGQLAETGGINPLQFGAKGDGASYEDSAFFDAINHALDSGIKKITITKGDYLLNNLLLLEGIDGFELEIKKGAKIFTTKHGWGIIEVVRSKNILIHGAGLVEGSHTVLDKNFNNTKGGGEKHAVLNAGLQWGAYRNDSLTTLGPHGGGYIGNSGIGILIHDGCENVSVTGIEIAGFNYSGVQVGFRGDTSEQNLNTSKNVRIDCYIHNCYSSGIDFFSVDGIDTSGSIVEDIGHPDALPTDQIIDPGYGITSTALSDISTQTKNAKINFCTIRRTKRKGIDTHASDGLQVLGNTIEDALVNGIGLTGTGNVRENVDIMYNTLIRCGSASLSGAIADLKSGITNKYEFANISKNRLIDCGSSTTIYSESDYTKIDDNILKSNTDAGKSDFHTAIDFAAGKGISAKGNIIKGLFKRGFRFRNEAQGQFDANEIDIEWSTETQPVLFENSKIVIGKNNLNKRVTSLRNSLNSTIQCTLLMEYSTSNSQPKVTMLDSDVSIAYEVIPSGAGAGLRFDVGFDISEKSFATTSYLGTKSENLAYITSYRSASGGRYLDIIISPRRLDNTVIPSNHADLNGLQLMVVVNLVGIV